MLTKTRLISLFLINGFFLFADRFLKWQSAHDWSKPYLFNKFLGWDPSLNSGVAFSIPLPNLLIIILTVPIIFIIIYLFARERDLILKFAALLIVFGAISNLFDRIFFKHIFDYLLIFTAIINLADIMIVAGFCIYLLRFRKTSPPMQS